MTLRTLSLSLVMATTAVAAAPKHVVIAGPAAASKVVEASLGKSAVVTRQSPLPSDVPTRTLVELGRSVSAVAIVVVAEAPGAVSIDVFNAADGAPLGHVEVRTSKKAPFKTVPKALLAQVQKAISQGKVAPAPKAPEKTPEVVVKTTPPPDDKTTTPVKTGQATTGGTTSVISDGSTEGPKPERESEIVKVSAGLRTFNRSLTWNDDLFGRMPKYVLPAGPAIAVDAEFFPLALVTHGALSHLGVEGAFEQAVGISSTDKTTGDLYTTSSMRFRAGALFALPIDRFTLGAHAGWSMQSFGFSATSTGSAPVARVNIPNVRYGAIRAGLTGAVEIIKPLSVELGLAYQGVLSSGEIGSATYFQHAQVGGADFTLSVAYRIIPNLEARLTAEYQRYWFTLNPNPGDPWIAGGALDEYKSVRVTVAWVL
jgi:hypothetical protein